MKTKLIVLFTSIVLWASTVLANYIGPVTICDANHAEGYALSPNGDFEYFQHIPWPARGWYYLQGSGDGGVTWNNVQHIHVGPQENAGNEEIVWYIPDPNYPATEYRWVN